MFPATVSFRAALSRLFPHLKTGKSVLNNFYFCSSTITNSLHTYTTPSTLSSACNEEKLSLWKTSVFPNDCRRTFFSSSTARNSNQSTTEGESQLKDTIRKCFPKATNVIVEDISGGCGSMYAIFIEAPDFQGLSTVQQHLLVNKALQKEIKSMHGIRIQTAASKTE